MSGGENTNSNSPPLVPAYRPDRRDRAALFSGSLSQRFIDAVLPARPRLLEMIENVAIDAQGDELLGVGERRRLGRKRLHRLGAGRLACRLGGLPRIAGSTPSLARHLMHACIAPRSSMA